MDKGYGQSDPRLAGYVEEVFGGDDAQLRDIVERQERAGLPGIQVSRLDGLHLEVIARACAARRAVEIGTLGGYSGVCLLRGMEPGGLLHTFELEPRTAEVARETFRRAGLEERVRLHVGPASERLADVEGDAPFDLVFIDADKLGYPLYLAWAAKHLRVGGVVLGDNAFLFGKVAEEPRGDDATRIRAMQSFNDVLARGGRFRATMLPTGEGLAFGVKIR
jgi:caffeoyl-CoA O-methyltransferase